MGKITPIENEEALAEALARIDQLWPKKDADQNAADEIKVLSVLISDYESHHHPIPPPSPIEAILFRMDQLGMNQSRLAETLGTTRARVSEIMNGKRELSLEMIRKLQFSLGIDAKVLVGSPRSTRI